MQVASENASKVFLLAIYFIFIHISITRHSGSASGRSSQFSLSNLSVKSRIASCGTNACTLSCSLNVRIKPGNIVAVLLAASQRDYAKCATSCWQHVCETTAGSAFAAAAAAKRRLVGQPIRTSLRIQLHSIGVSVCKTDRLQMLQWIWYVIGDRMFVR